MLAALSSRLDRSLFDSQTRLYRLELEPGSAELLVEAWSLREALNEPWTMELSTLGLHADLELDAVLGQHVTLQTVLADKTLQPRSGLILSVTAEDADGGFARYRMVVRPWPALLAHSRRSRVWQEQTLVAIVEDVLRPYAAHAQWRWSDCVAEHLARSPFNGSGASSSPTRSYTVQYRETDLGFITRLLAEDGMGWRIEEDSEAPASHTLVFFADSQARASCPEDASSLAAGGIRFHRASSQ